MANHSEVIKLDTHGFTDIADITAEVQAIVERSGIRSGLVCVAVPGSTGGVTTIEHEDGALKDLAEALEKIAPERKAYHHDAAWGDRNGFAHVRSALIGTSQSFPVLDGRVVLGTWQQIVFIDFDNRPRNRRLVVQVVGDKE